jgi:hypothetical protein
MTRLALAAALLAGAALVAAPDQPADGFTPLFNGRDLSGWKFVLPSGADPAQTWTVQDGYIRCTGKPNGYFYTEGSFTNYTFRYEWRYPKEQPPRSTLNSGLLVHIQPPHKTWPKCVEVQGAMRTHGTMFLLEVKGEKTYDAEAAKKAIKPQGEWNLTEVVCAADGSLKASINGTPVSTAKTELTGGPIGFQSEAAEIHFRNIGIKTVK